MPANRKIRWAISAASLLMAAIALTVRAVPADAAEVVDPVAALTSGAGHTCVLLTDHTVSCWGDNRWGALGDGTFVPWEDERATPSPVTVIDLGSPTNPPTAIDAGDGHTCALLSDRTVSCWGLNHRGQLGSPTNDGSQDRPEPHPVPLPVAGVTDAVAVSAGGSLTCALLADQSVTCWGGSGEVFPGTSGHRPYPVVDISDATAIAAGGATACAILVGGQVRCWGVIHYGPLRDEFGEEVPPPVAGVEGAVELAVGAHHACALLDDGTVRCWGRNDKGQLGNPANAGSQIPVDEPVPVTGISGATAIAAIGDNTCASLDDGTVRCWGANGEGELGNNTRSNPSTANPGAVAVTGISEVTDLSARCALLGDQTVRCWGPNNLGALGDAHPDPAPVAGLGETLGIASGADHACALQPDRTVTCWGRNTVGQLGVEDRADSTAPVTVPDVTDAAAIDAGSQHTCALLTDGTVRCWGSNSLGAVDPGQQATRLPPVTVPGITDAVALTADGQLTCTVHADDQVSCWGTGAPGPSDRIAGVSGARAVLAWGNQSACALVAAGDVVCWRHGFAGSSLPPRPVSGIDEATALVELDERACVLHDDGSADCWGDDLAAEPISDLTDAGAAASGPWHSCVLRAGQVACRGLNSWGEVGDGTTTDASTFVTALDIDDATEIDAGDHHTCARLSDRTVRCWGTWWSTGSAVPLTVTGLPAGSGPEPEPEPDVCESPQPPDPDQAIELRCGPVTMSATGAGAVTVTRSADGTIRITVRAPTRP